MKIKPEGCTCDPYIYQTGPNITIIHLFDCEIAKNYPQAQLYSEWEKNQPEYQPELEPKKKWWHCGSQK